MNFHLIATVPNEFFGKFRHTLAVLQQIYFPSLANVSLLWSSRFSVLLNTSGPNCWDLYRPLITVSSWRLLLSQNPGSPLCFNCSLAFWMTVGFSGSSKAFLSTTCMAILSLELFFSVCWLRCSLLSATTSFLSATTSFLSAMPFPYSQHPQFP